LAVRPQRYIGVIMNALIAIGTHLVCLLFRLRAAANGREYSFARERHDRLLYFAF
jgi:hypothetical protein